MHLVCPLNILYKHCFQFLLGRLQCPGEMKNKGLCKIWESKQGVLCEMCKWWIVIVTVFLFFKEEHHSLRPPFAKILWIIMCYDQWIIPRRHILTKYDNGELSVVTTILIRHHTCVISCSLAVDVFNYQHTHFVITVDCVIRTALDGVIVVIPRDVWREVCRALKWSGIV